jgi:serine/threonine protein kinase
VRYKKRPAQQAGELGLRSFIPMAIQYSVLGSQHFGELMQGWVVVALVVVKDDGSWPASPGSCPPSSPGMPDDARERRDHAMSEQPTTGDWPAPGGAELGGWPVLPGYQILAELGRGGMGVVYKAWQESLKRLVALKMIRAGAPASPEERYRFHIEAAAAARLRHPNVVSIYEVGEHAGQPYFAMELLEGGSLHTRLAGRPQPARQAAALVRTLALAVQHAHEQKIVHRDLKPANILLSPNPKSQIPNPKQIPITQEQNPKRESARVSDLGDSDLDIVWDLGFRLWANPKSQIPNPKSQIPNPKQIPITQEQNPKRGPVSRFLRVSGTAPA